VTDEIREHLEGLKRLPSRKETMERWENSNEFVGKVFGTEIHVEPNPVALAFAEAACQAGANCSHLTQQRA
jgi:hypothetical protein